MKRNGLTVINLHGEGNGMAPEKEAVLMTPWIKKFHALLEEKCIPPKCLYNADYTGLYYQKLLNTLYVNTEQKKSFCGGKCMKDKTCITLMV